MPCNCTNCDCQDSTTCYLIQARLNGLACIFDLVANNPNLAGAGGVFSGYTAQSIFVCDDLQLSNAFTLTSITSTSNVAGLFVDITGVSPSDFIPSVDVLTSVVWVNAGICIPTAVGACMACSSMAIGVNPLCEITTESADLANYAAIAQNLRYIAQLYGC